MTAESGLEDDVEGMAVGVGLAVSLLIVICVEATAAAALASALRWARAARGEFRGNLGVSKAALAGGEEVDGLEAADWAAAAAAKPGKFAGLNPGRPGMALDVGGGKRRRVLGRGDSHSSFSRSRLTGEPARPCTSC